jgi:thiamine-monophosphate kinase
VLLTGPVGGSLLGRHLSIEPRFAEGRFLHAAGAHALMDVSDGLALDLARLARRSGVRIDLERVPVHADADRAARRDGRSARDHALSDGEDHELLATISARAWRRVAARARRRFPRLVVVGRVRAGSGLFLARAGASRGDARALVRWDGWGGWIHGG